MAQLIKTRKGYKIRSYILRAETNKPVDDKEYALKMLKDVEDGENRTLSVNDLLEHASSYNYTMKQLNEFLQKDRWSKERITEVVRQYRLIKGDS